MPRIGHIDPIFIRGLGYVLLIVNSLKGRQTMKKVTLVLLAFFLLTACATTKEGRIAQKTSGVIGCPPEEIKITNIQEHLGDVSYSAECRGKKFQCLTWGSYDLYTYGDYPPPACKEEIK